MRTQQVKSTGKHISQTFKPKKMPIGDTRNNSDCGSGSEREPRTENSCVAKDAGRTWQNLTETVLGKKEQMGEKMQRDEKDLPVKTRLKFATATMSPKPSAGWETVASPKLLDEKKLMEEEEMLDEEPLLTETFLMDNKEMQVEEEPMDEQE